MQLHDIHSKLYEEMPEGTIINVCERSTDDARLVSDNTVEVAVALGHDGEKLEAAQEGDTHHIDIELTRRFQALLTKYGAEE